MRLTLMNARSRAPIVHGVTSEATRCRARDVAPRHDVLVHARRAAKNGTVDSSEYPYPSKLTRFLSPDIDPGFYANLDFVRDMSDEARVFGFRRGAELLYSAIREAPGHDAQDLAFFPFAAIWRHQLELELKAALEEGRELWGVSEPVPSTHDLMTLWGALRKLIELKAREETRPGRHHVTEALKQLNKMDPDAQSFRYAKGTDGQPTLAEIDQVDLASFHRAAVEVSNYLEALRAMIDHYLEVQQEMAYGE